ncbi:helicase-related protein [Paracoccus sp. MC1862]|uniref:helicase-related protein n=1 Tax=Paracoccus sp. MC1862 TaxID=2760307 RepID=UPI0016004EED|nr:helicase-related protein [Paracoccus sp. MC1862]MBB1498757.1 DEAD/DEAH box helicase [Paracoccus sp. MC1862]QQO43918.1 DEAD/DEAH box helicase [Paracoccus sp. MC1862]
MPRSPKTGRADGRLGNAECAAALAEQLPQGDIIFAAETETDALAVARALAVAAPDAQVILLPESDALPGDSSPASPANIGLRNAGLSRLRGHEGGPAALITTADALALSWPAPSEVPAELLRVTVGTAIDLPSLRDSILALGYAEDDRVDEPGETALRGQVLDVFPAQSENPVRIEVAEGKVAWISLYDLVDQRTLSEVDSCAIAPAIEPPLGDARCALPDHLPGARLVLSPAADKRRRNVLKLAAEIGGAAALRRVLPDDAWAASIEGGETLDLDRAGDPAPRFVESRAPERAFTRAAHAAFDAGERLVLLGSERDLRFLSRRAARLLERTIRAADSWEEVIQADPGSLLSLPMPAERGFRRQGVLAVAAADLLGSRALREDAVATGQTLLDQVGIRIGDVVVHEDHGIGVVAGIEPLPDLGEGDPGEAIRLTYAADGVRLVPVLQAHRIWRYGAEPEAVTLDRLDGSSWRKRKDEVEAAVAETAKGLAELAEARKGQQAPVLEGEPADYERFAAGFAFTETPDQARAIDAVRDDLASGKPMDRLVIGDVGYGKTEVALRAAAVAVLEGRQVAVAAPTTVLARQHVETFGRRFAPLGKRVGALHRLSTAAEKKAVKEGLADGSIDIVIGTGAVAGKGVAYKDLGLVIIDEEQRFGTADKQKLRDLSAGHVLTLTATPIPRTLQSALVGLQQLSVIATPPARRQPIRTSVAPFDAASLRAALLRERARRGQSFVVVPRIEDMELMAAELRELLPGFEILQAHGKLPAAEIDEAMIRFSRGEGDVLLATNIIEAGLDVPQANTMVVCKADRFGLSQLHQLRGRVGRGNQRAHMLIFTEAGKTIPDLRLKRLRTLETLNRLGAGFEISARDLDLRGAGDLLGEEQAGHMKLIGIELYQQLLADALSARGGADQRWIPNLQPGLQGRLPENWIADPDTRLEIYMRLARMDSSEAVDLLEAELEDRFGDIPPEARTLLQIVRLREAAHAAGIARVVAGPAGIVLYPREGVAPDAEGLERQEDCLVLREAIEDPRERLDRTAELLAAIVESSEDMEPAQAA